MKPHEFSKASTDWVRASCLSHPWRRESCTQLSSPGDSLSWGPFLPSRWHRLAATSPAVLPTKGISGTWQCLGLAVTAASFGSCSFSHVCYMTFLFRVTNSDLLWAVWSWGTDINLWLLIQGILDLRWFWTRAGLAYCCLELSAPRKLMGRGKISQPWG